MSEAICWVRYGGKQLTNSAAFGFPRKLRLDEVRHENRTDLHFIPSFAVRPCAAEVEVVALLLLHMREDALIRQLEVDPKLRKWLKELLLQLPSAYDCYSAEAYPLTQTTQKYGGYSRTELLLPR